MSRHQPLLAAALVLVSAVFLTGCASFKPKPLALETLRASAPLEQRGGVTVRARLLSHDEINQHFDSRLWKKGIQPVWIEVEMAAA